MGQNAVKLNRSGQQEQSDLFISKTPSRCGSLNEEKIDPFTLIWLDEKSNENTLDALRTKTLLRQINNDFCFFFDDPNIFLYEIEKMHHENKKILVVMSGRLAEMILPKIGETISTIIIFCSNYNKYTKLTSGYWNVTDVCTDHETLRNCIEREIPSLKLNLFINQNLRSVRSLNSSKDAFNANGAHFSYLLFIELLKQMPQTKKAKEIMLKKCKDYYRCNTKELAKIDLFHSTYTPDQAINWYTKDCFVYRLVNQAFRTEDVSLWYLFRFFIIDLCTQLENVHREQNIRDCLKLYRGQARMPTQELENLRSNIGGCILTNAFLSTSQNINIAQQFIVGAENNDEFKVVMFEIIMNIPYLRSTVFVDIDQYQGTNGESEILFNIGSIFQIQNIEYDSQVNVWKIQMEATDECKPEIERQINRMRKKFQNGSINMIFGRLLIDMHQYTKAESYFQMMLRILPRHHEDLASIYDHIGHVNMRKNNWNEAYRNFSAAYDIKKIRLCSKHPSLAVTLNNIGNYYQAIGEFAQALNCYSKVLLCNNDQHHAAITQINIGKIYTVNGQLEEALNLTLEARDVLQQIESCSKLEFIHCQGIIGDIYLAQKDYVAAEHFYLTAFQLSKMFLCIGNPGETSCVKALAHLYHQKGNIHQAILFCLEQLTLYDAHLGENHSSIAHLLMKLAELYTDDVQEKLQVLKRALHILEKNVHLEYATTATCLTMIGKYYVQKNQFDRASMCHLRALEIQEKIYPPNHSIIMETRILINSQENKTK